MKKFLLFFVVLYAAATASAGKSEQFASAKWRLLEPGRTWWYEMTYEFGGPVFGVKNCELGMSVGDEVEIDGKKWRKIDVVLCKNRYWNEELNNGNGPVEFDSSVKTIAYMREDGADVYARIDNEGLASYPLLNDFVKGRENEWTEYIEADTEYHIYHFGNIGDKFTLSNSEYTKDYILSDISEMESEGHRYKVYTMKYPEWENYSFKMLNIGVYFKRGGGVVFMPDIVQYSNGELVPILTYVTDAMNNNEVIYKGKGGDKLWEEYLSQAEIEADGGSDAPARWFTPAGVEVTAPTAPGIYIRQCGGQATKVMVK